MRIVATSQDCCRFTVKKAATGRKTGWQAAWAKSWQLGLEKVESMQLIVVKVELLSLLVDMMCL